MRNIITNFKNCVGIIIVCAVVALVLTLVDSAVESQTKKGEGVCTVGKVAQAGARAHSLYNDLRQETIVVELTCDGASVVTRQPEIILAVSASHPPELQCLWHANDTAKCTVPATAEAAQ